MNPHQIVNRLLGVVAEQVVIRAAEKRALSNKLAHAFGRVGLDGNGRFESKALAVQALARCLDEVGLSLGIVTGDLLIGDRGSRAFPLFKKKVETANTFDPDPETNLHISFTWEKMSAEKYEVLCYIAL